MKVSLCAKWQSDNSSLFMCCREEEEVKVNQTCFFRVVKSLPHVEKEVYILTGSPDFEPKESNFFQIYH